MLIKTDFCLKPFNSFHVAVFARRLAVIGSVIDLVELFDEGAIKKEKNILIVGEGSNILFTKHFDGLVLLNQLRGKSIVHEDDDHIYLKVNGGENWPLLVDHAVEKGWGGIENLSLIPGTVGAAPIQNIGAYGAELKDVLTELEIFDLNSGERKTLTNADCKFGYRDSIFKSALRDRNFILSITLKLTRRPGFNLEYAPLKKKFEGKDKKGITLKEVSNAVKEIRRSKLPDPQKLGNAGSFFKNPVVPFSKIEELVTVYPEMPFYKVDDKNYKIAAGWLIEQTGWKGKRIGDAGVYEKQALVLINFDKATGQEIFDLSEKILRSVKDRFGISLDREVRVF